LVTGYLGILRPKNLDGELKQHEQLDEKSCFLSRITLSRTSLLIVILGLRSSLGAWRRGHFMEIRLAARLRIPSCRQRFPNAGCDRCR
jgi:hypothetical protein